MSAGNQSVMGLAGSAENPGAVRDEGLQHQRRDPSPCAAPATTSSPGDAQDRAANHASHSRPGWLPGGVGCMAGPDGGLCVVVRARPPASVLRAVVPCIACTARTVGRACAACMCVVDHRQRIRRCAPRAGTTDFRDGGPGDGGAGSHRSHGVSRRRSAARRHCAGPASAGGSHRGCRRRRCRLRPAGLRGWRGAGSCPAGPGAAPA